MGKSEDRLSWADNFHWSFPLVSVKNQSNSSKRFPLHGFPAAEKLLLLPSRMSSRLKNSIKFPSVTDNICVTIRADSLTVFWPATDYGTGVLMSWFGSCKLGRMMVISEVMKKERGRCWSQALRGKRLLNSDFICRLTSAPLLYQYLPWFPDLRFFPGSVARLQVEPTLDFCPTFI